MCPSVFTALIASGIAFGTLHSKSLDYALIVRCIDTLVAVALLVLLPSRWGSSCCLIHVISPRIHLSVPKSGAVEALQALLPSDGAGSGLCDERGAQGLYPAAQGRRSEWTFGSLKSLGEDSIDSKRLITVDFAATAP